MSLILAWHSDGRGHPVTYVAITSNGKSINTHDHFQTCLSYLFDLQNSCKLIAEMSLSNYQNNNVNYKPRFCAAYPNSILSGVFLSLIFSIKTGKTFLNLSFITKLSFSVENRFENTISYRQTD